MPMVAKVREFFGVDSPRILDGYRLSTRGARLPACDTCGALVAYESQALHGNWHAQMQRR